MSDEYNGWTNRETWAANLWLSNDEGVYNLALERARDALDGYTTRCDTYGLEPTRDGAAMSVGEELSAQIEELEELLIPESYRSMRDDIGSLWRIDWQELGEAWLEQISEETPEGFGVSGKDS